MRAAQPQQPTTFECISRSVEETQHLGEHLGGCLVPGDVVGLIGALGSGKTTLIQGLARGLGIDPAMVKSPTFILLREYAGRIPLIHIDGYRLDHAADVVWLDVEWVFSPKKVTVIEWADQLAGHLPEDYLEIRLAHRTTNQRSIQLIGHGLRSLKLVEQLTAAFHTKRETGENHTRQGGGIHERAGH